MLELLHNTFDHHFLWRGRWERAGTITMRAWYQHGSLFRAEDHHDGDGNGPAEELNWHGLWMTLSANRGLTEAGIRLFEAMKHVNELGRLADINRATDEEWHDYQDAKTDLMVWLTGLDAEQSGKKIAASEAIREAVKQGVAVAGVTVLPRGHLRIK